MCGTDEVGLGWVGLGCLCSRPGFFFLFLLNGVFVFVLVFVCGGVCCPGRVKASAEVGFVPVARRYRVQSDVAGTPWGVQGLVGSFPERRVEWNGEGKQVASIFS